jgi:tyrosyl-tRNA synthetase
MPIDSPHTVIELIQRLLPGRSKSELRRLVAQGGVRIDSRRPTAFDELIDIHDDGVIVRAGRHNWARFVRAGTPTQSPGGDHP